MVETRGSKRKKEPAQSKRVLVDGSNTLEKAKDSAPPKKRQRKSLATDLNSAAARLGDSNDKKSKREDVSSRNKRGKGRKSATGASQKDHFSDLPVDVFLEIAVRLTADSLLQLSRVSHSLRDIILSKRNRHIWVKCISNSGAYPCPDDLTEPKYTSLVFDEFCSICATSHESMHLYQELRVRYCSKCFFEKLEDGKTLVEEFDPSLVASPEIYTLIPHMDDNGLVHPSVHLSTLQKELFVREDFLAALEGFKEAKSKNVGCQIMYTIEQHERRHKIIQQSKNISEWLLIRRREEHYDLMYTRMKSTIDAIKERGYTDEEVRASAFEYYLNLPKLFGGKFSAREQERLMSRAVIKIETDKMEKRRKELGDQINARKEDVMRAYRQYLQSVKMTYGERVTFPKESTVLGLTHIRKLMEYEVYSRPITYDLWLEYLPAMEKTLYTDRRRLIINHAEMLGQSRINTDHVVPDIPVLEQIYVASSFFSAWEYKGPYYVSPISACPAIIGERKISPWFDSEVRDGPKSDGSSENTPSGVRLESQDDAFKVVKVHEEAVAMASSLLDDLEMPQATLMKEMLDFGERFVCQRCDEEERYGMSWLGIIEHYLYEESWIDEANALPESTSNIEIIDDHSQDDNYDPLVRILRDEELEHLCSGNPDQNAGSDDKKCKCRLCESLGLPTVSMARRQVEIHIRKKHGKSTIELQDIRVPPTEELIMD